MIEQKQLEGYEDNFVYFINENQMADGSQMVEIIFDEITNDFNDYVCSITQKFTREGNVPFKDKDSLLSKKFDQYFLNYKELEFNCIVITIDGKDYNVCICLKRVGDYLKPFTNTTPINPSEKSKHKKD